MSAFNQDSGAKLLAALKRGIENITLNVLNENPRDYHKRGRVIGQDEWGWTLSIDNATYTRIPSLERVADYKQGDVVEVMIPNGQPSNMFIMGRLGGVVSSESSDGVTKEYLNSVLLNYVTNTNLTLALANYVTTANLNDILSGYVTDAKLATQLANYVTTTALNNALGAYAKTTDLAKVSTSGSYNDLTDKPTIPENVVRYTAQTLTETQKTQARTNIGAGTSSFDGNYNSLSNLPDEARHTVTVLTNEDLIDYTGENKVGWYYGVQGNTCSYKPSGVDAFSLEVIQTGDLWFAQLMNTLHGETPKRYIRYNIEINTWTDWVELDAKGDTGATGAKGDTGKDGTTFTPSVSQDGVISWTNDGDKPNPTAVNIKGPQGSTGTVALTASGIISGDTSSLVVGQVIPVGQLSFNRTPVVGDNFICLIKDINNNREYIAGMQIDNWGTPAISKRGKIITLTEIAVISSIFPVHSIYISYGDESPASFIANTVWEKIADRFLVGAGNLYTAGSTGGSKDAVVVEHNHPVHLDTVGLEPYSVLVGPGTTVPSVTTASTRLSAQTVGVDGTDKNLPPYLAVNIWKRVS